MTSSGLTLLDTAEQLGSLRAWELAAFATFGAGARSAEHPGLVVLLDRIARSHGWRADLLSGRLPVIGGRIIGENAAAGAGLGELSNEPAGVEGGRGHDVGLTLAVAAVLVVGPNLVERYRALAARVDDRTDAPTASVLAVCQAEATAAGRHGTAVLDRLTPTVDPTLIDSVTARLATFVAGGAPMADRGTRETHS